MTGWEALGFVGAAMTLTSLTVLIVIAAARLLRGNDAPSHTVYLIGRDDRVFAYQLDEAIRRHHVGGRG